MSYVIENFYLLQRSVVLTPRLKFLIIFKSINKLLFFFKINFFFKSTKKFFNFYENHFLLLYKYFYFSSILKFFFNLNLSLSANYTNNFKKSLVFNGLTSIDFFLTKQKFFSQLPTIQNLFLYNLYFTSIKIANFKINKNFYQNVFFFLMFVCINPWYSHTSFFKFSLNFFFVTKDIQLCKFYNGFFFKVYNY